ncbi:50S ribosomal protein L18 [Candidatus Uhrbacteria bacterium]|nr:50S ribosomal protein L18 [Candidatus Uhrbacteria bacterium]
MKKDVLKTIAKARRIIRVRAKISGTAERPRLAVRRSLSHIYAQLIDDVSKKTLVAASDKDVKGKFTKTEAAAEVGKILAEKAVAKKIQSVVFDRRDKRYHGRVKALADGARAGGLKF